MELTTLVLIPCLHVGCRGRFLPLTTEAAGIASYSCCCWEEATHVHCGYPSSPFGLSAAFSPGPASHRAGRGCTRGLLSVGTHWRCVHVPGPLCPLIKSLCRFSNNCMLQLVCERGLPVWKHQTPSQSQHGSLGLLLHNFSCFPLVPCHTHFFVYCQK